MVRAVRVCVGGQEFFIREARIGVGDARLRAADDPSGGRVNLSNHHVPAPVEIVSRFAQKRRPWESKAIAVSPLSELAPATSGKLLVLEKVRPAFVETSSPFWELITTFAGSVGLIATSGSMGLPVVSPGVVSGPI